MPYAVKTPIIWFTGQRHIKVKNIYDFLKKCECFFIASINDGFPAVRPFGAVMEYENNFYISTSPHKKVYKQLKANSHIQIAALKNGTRKWLRISGLARECADLKIKKKMLEKCPEIAKHFTAENDQNFIIFQIKPLKIQFKEGSKTLMERKIFNKLVRDKIPEMLEANGGEPETETLTEEKYINCLYEKLKEECEETINSYSKENLMEELADLLEVMMAISNANGFNFSEIEKIRLAKKEKRGGFDSKIFLKSSNVINKI